MKKKVVKDQINESNYLDDLYLEKDEITAEIYDAEERGLSDSTISNLVKQLREVEQKIEWEEIEQAEIEEYELQKKGINPYE